MLLKVLQILIMLKFQILLTLNYNLIYLNAESDAESAIKKKRIDLFSELIGFKFVATLVLVFKKVDSKDKQNMTLSIQAQKEK